MYIHQYIKQLNENVVISSIVFAVMSLNACYVVVQIGEEVAKLLQLKAQLGDEGTKQFLLKTPKVNTQNIEIQIRDWVQHL